MNVRMINLPDIYSDAMWILYYILINNILLSRFILMKINMKWLKLNLPYNKQVMAEHMMKIKLNKI